LWKKGIAKNSSFAFHKMMEFKGDK
jgi:hypothetical protein